MALRGARCRFGDGRRRRRGSDAVRLILSVLGVLCAVLLVRADPHPEIVIQRVLSPAPDGVRWLVDLVRVIGSFGIIAIALVLAVAVRGWAGLRDLVASAVGALAACGLLILGLGADGGRPYTASLNGYSRSFPVIPIAVVMAVVTAALPYLARTLQRLIVALVALAVVATVVAGQGLPVNVLGSMAIGWGVTAAVHLCFGSPLGLPSGDEVRALLGTIGIAPISVAPSPYQTWGAAHYTADMGDSEPLAISFYGRDAVDAQLLAKVWRFIFYRGTGALPALTRIQQVEHESSITQLAARAGARVPEVRVASTLGPKPRRGLITRAPLGRPLAELDSEEVSDAHLEDLFAQMLRLRTAAISHGAVSPYTIVVDPGTGLLTLTDFRRGTSAASTFTLDQDLAGAMATAALSVGPERTVASAVRAVPPEALTGALAHLRRAGLDPSITLGLKGRKDLLDQVRTQTAQAATIEVPELVEPRRMSWNQVLVAVGTLIGGWALILVLINVSHSFSTIEKAQWGWVIATAIFCGASFLANALSDVGSVPGSLVYGRALGLEVANSFAVLAGGNAVRRGRRGALSPTAGLRHDDGGDVGRHRERGQPDRQGRPVRHRHPSGLELLPLQQDRAPRQPFHSALADLGCRLRRRRGPRSCRCCPPMAHQGLYKLRHHLAIIRDDFKQLASRPSKAVELFGGRIAAQLLLTLALGSALHAFGASLSLAALIIAITMAGVLASASPAGGGMGVAEAGLILALTAGGIPKEIATAAVFVQRLFSAYLPPVLGWLTFMWMRRKEYL